MKNILIVVNFCILIFCIYEFFKKIYKFLNRQYLYPPEDYMISYYFESALQFLPFIILYLLNILILSNKIKFRIIYFITILMNSIILLFSILVISIGISEELNPEMLERNKILFSANSHDILIILHLGILLPFFSAYYIYKQNKKNKSLTN